MPGLSIDVLALLSQESLPLSLPTKGEGACSTAVSSLFSSGQPRPGNVFSESPLGSALDRAVLHTKRMRRAWVGLHRRRVAYDTKIVYTNFVAIHGDQHEKYYV